MELKNAFELLQKPIKPVIEKNKRIFEEPYITLLQKEYDVKEDGTKESKKSTSWKIKLCEKTAELLGFNNVGIKFISISNNDNTLFLINTTNLPQEVAKNNKVLKVRLNIDNSFSSKEIYNEIVNIFNITDYFEKDNHIKIELMEDYSPEVIKLLIPNTIPLEDDYSKFEKLVEETI